MKKYFVLILILALSCALLACCTTPEKEESKEESKVTETSKEDENKSDDTSKTDISEEDTSKEDTSEQPLGLVLPVVGGKVKETLYRNRQLTKEEIEIFSLLEGGWRVDDRGNKIYFERYKYEQNKENKEKYLVTFEGVSDGQSQLYCGRINRIYVTDEFEITVSVFYPEYVLTNRAPVPESTGLYVFDLSELYEKGVISTDLFGENETFKRG